MYKFTEDYNLYRIRFIPVNKGHMMPVPKRAHDTDSGYDIKSSEYVVLEPGSIKLIHTNWKVDLDEGYELQVRSRSGLALKHGIMVLNSPGTIDSGYKDEIGIILFNAGKEPFEIRAGDRVAQLVLNKVLPSKAVISFEERTKEDRGGGFGSTGV